MTYLKPDWLTDGLIDLEYKKYILLGYLQSVKSQFGEYQLYPFMSDLVFHYRNLQLIKDQKTLLYSDFPKRITKADFEKLKLTYQQIIADGSIMQEIENILAFAIPEFKKVMNEGKNIFEYIKSKIEITSIGLSPLYHNEGYLMINQPPHKELKIYEYKVTVFENSNEKYRGINTQFLETISKGIGRTFENIKLELINKYTHLPNPATYLVETGLPLPLQPTLLPVAKRMLIQRIDLAA